MDEQKGKRGSWWREGRGKREAGAKRDGGPKTRMRAERDADSQREPDREFPGKRWEGLGGEGKDLGEKKCPGSGPLPFLCWVP